MDVENSPDSHKPVEIGDLGSQGDSKIWGSLEVQNGPPGPSGALLSRGRGRCAACRGRHSVPTRMIFRLSGRKDR